MYPREFSSVTWVESYSYSFYMHFIWFMYVCVCMLSHVWLCDPMNCCPEGSSVHETFEARVLAWIAFSKGSSWPRGWTHMSCICCLGRWILWHQCHLGSPIYTHTHTHTHQMGHLDFHLWHWASWRLELADYIYMHWPFCHPKHCTRPWVGYGWANGLGPASWELCLWCKPR